jgi:hypothetical protein
MRPENSRQYYLPPSLEGSDQPAATPHPAPAIFPRPTSKRERTLQQITYILVSLAAFVYVCQALIGGIGAVLPHRLPSPSSESASPEPPAAGVQTQSKFPPPVPGSPKSETIFGPLPRTR